MINKCIILYYTSWFSWIGDWAVASILGNPPNLGATWAATWALGRRSKPSQLGLIRGVYGTCIPLYLYLDWFIYGTPSGWLLGWLLGLLHSDTLIRQFSQTCFHPWLRATISQFVVKAACQDMPSILAWISAEGRNAALLCPLFCMAAGFQLEYPRCLVWPNDHTVVPCPLIVGYYQVVKASQPTNKNKWSLNPSLLFLIFDDRNCEISIWVAKKSQASAWPNPHVSCLRPNLLVACCFPIRQLNSNQE